MNTETPNTAIAERKADAATMGALAIVGGTARVPGFQSMRDILEFAKVMAGGGVALPAHCRGNPGICAAIILQAQRLEMEPYTVARQSYVVNDQLAYMSQLITSIINTRAPIKGRLRTRFTGEGNSRRCVASAIFVGDETPTEVTSPPFASIQPKNSPLWKTDPDQQLAYYTKRLWARRECPEVLLGVYDGDEFDERGPERARDVTPARPTRAEFADAGAENPGGGEALEDLWEFVDAEGNITEQGVQSWADAFRLSLESKTLTPEMKDGVWESNSPMLAKLRAYSSLGETMAQDIHDAQVERLREQDEAAAAARAAQEKQNASPSADGKAGGDKASPATAGGLSPADSDALVDYARRIARNSGSATLEAWWGKQSKVRGDALEPHREALFKIAGEADAAHQQRQDQAGGAK